ncbi:hypothetical protein H2O64_12840 [Kordia sp. YSTF-M3]|uniref:Bacteriocin n=1 Tax=Kordia aestuariivivens TaxID=2759037 RepID=A0ABR7QB30_9FLAO|nr:hypothetical protein [Kordia aestuariivivens]MBC8755556.1 hypothetical protein [Kordia aestuariivivens]
MKKQNLDSKLSLKTSKVSKLGNASEIIGGATTFCPSANLCEITAYHRCGHTIGNGQNPDGTPCTY